MKEAYLATDKQFDIECRYAFNQKFKLITPVSETTKGKDFIQREFIIENETRSVPMSFTLREVNKRFEFTIEFDNKHVSVGRLQKREFYIPPPRDNSFSNEFEASRITCAINFAYALPYTLTDGNYHIAVHPHQIYDWQSLLKNQIESYLNDSQLKSMVLLETGNYRGNLVNISSFLAGMDYKLPQVSYPSDLTQVPADTLLIVSPAGHNRYSFMAENELIVTFTGGNHNYCIWNNTREILESFMKSKSQAKVTIYYDTKAIVAQARGIEGFRFNFPKQDINRSNLLKNLFKNKENTLNYHSNYHRYFKGIFFKEFIGMFKTVKLNYQAIDYAQTDIIQGQGLRDLEINLIYLY